ncbi:AbrB family transcriptional regulator [Gracilibacillus dipsosauri]|uniref:AbrB family transcriptional regulator n=2 Tax=Gracilibacillus TaxID=74385 RepID=A0A317KZP8_9BACI|nr:AbrB family transcriptional regulator [Gracilibacillus dipsosauri]PWU68696.1 hypothetical protein DLJ74_09715 [Gracilibacillus dipsosauri]
MKQLVFHYIWMYLVSLLSTMIFLSLDLPLPWILGPLLAVFILKTVHERDYQLHQSIRNVSFAITGVQIGMTFTAATIGKVVPYFIPFLLFTFFIMIISIASGILLARIAKISKKTGVLGSIPGGLSVMVAMSDSMEANTGLVAIFHTIRLMAVLFIVPIIASFLFSSSSNNAGSIVEEPMISGQYWTIAIYGLLFYFAYLLRHKVPASFVLIPMTIIAILKIFSIPVMDLPSSFYHFAQLSIGIHLGLSIDYRDVKKAGKYTGLFFLITCFIILLSILFGYIFASFSNLSFATAMLSLAPGGLVEMALTAHEVDADPAIVGSLQLVRMLIIILLLPIVLSKYWKTRT